MLTSDVVLFSPSFQSIRGQTFNLLFIDEANFIRRESLPAILGFMLQKDAKLIFISSVNTSDNATSFLLKLKTASEKMLNIVNYVCPLHKEDFHLQDNLISCPCYRLMIPTYITIDESVKHTTNLLMDDVFNTELVGDSYKSSLATQYRVISDSSLTYLDLCRVDSSASGSDLNTEMYIYVDPAYSNNVDASGTGIAAVVPYKNSDRAIIVGLEHYFLKDLTGAAAIQIAMCAVHLIKSVSTLHPFINQVRLAVEGNSSQDSAVAIASFINDSSPLPVSFAQYSDRGGLKWPMYILGQEKSKAFEDFIFSLNSGKLCASQVIVSNTIKLSYDPVSYLIDQIKGLKCKPLRDGAVTFCAKQPHLSDDTLVAAVMSYYLSKIDYSFRPMKHQQ